MNNLAELLLFGFAGKTLSTEARELLEKEHIGGTILFKRNIETLEQVVALNKSIVDVPRKHSPTLISVDQEGGRVARLRGICTDIPPMRVIGNLSKGNRDVPFRLGALMARELVSLGFHLDFAPVVDVDTNPKNPIIGDRSFSDDATQVAKISADFIRGMQGAGLAACAKHFPGHGDTDKDSHLDLPVLRHSLERLMQVELVPFVAAKEANVASIMTAHILFPEIDPNYPATLSPLVLQQLLREQIGYEGVIISDDLEMKAVADRYEIKEMLRLGLLAGVDLFLICEDLGKTHAAISALHELVDSGAVPKSRVEEAIARVLAMKERYVGAPASPVLDDARRVVRSSPHLALASEWESA